MYNLFESFEYSVVQTLLWMKQCYSLILRGYHITTIELHLLNHVNGNQGKSQRELAELMVKDSHHISRLIDSLEKRSLVKRLPDSHDRRIWRIQITTNGSNLLNRLSTEMSIFTQKITSGISKSEINQLKITGSKLINNYKHYYEQEVQHER